MGKNKKSAVQVSITINVNGRQDRPGRRLRQLVIGFNNPQEGEGGEPGTAECDNPFLVRATVVDDEPCVAGDVSVGAVLSLAGSPPVLHYDEGEYDDVNEEWVMEFADVTWPDSGTCHATVIATKGGGEPTTRTVAFLPCAADSTGSGDTARAKT